MQEAKDVIPDSIPGEDKLILYALFKQATVGDIDTDRPGIFDQKGRCVCCSLHNPHAPIVRHALRINTENKHRSLQVGPLGEAKGCAPALSACLVYIFCHPCIPFDYTPLIQYTLDIYIHNTPTYPELYTSTGKSKEQAMEEYITKVEQLKEKYC